MYGKSHTFERLNRTLSKEKRRLGMQNQPYKRNFFNLKFCFKLRMKIFIFYHNLCLDGLLSAFCVFQSLKLKLKSQPFEVLYEELLNLTLTTEFQAQPLEFNQAIMQESSKSLPSDESPYFYNENTNEIKLVGVDRADPSRLLSTIE